MKWAYRTWTVLCGLPVVVVFFEAPAWDTSTPGWGVPSGTGIFFLLTVLVGVVWVIGLAILYSTAHVEWRRGRDRP